MSTVTRRRSFSILLVNLLVGLCAVLLLPDSLRAVEHKRVMILHSVGREFRPWNVYAKEIRAALDRQSPWPLDVQEHSLVTARSTDLNPEGPFVEYLGALYGDQQPDLVVSVGAPAAAFVQRYRQQLFPKTPMLFTAVEQRRVKYSELGDNDTVVAVRHDFRVLFESFLRISPDTKVIAVVNGSSPNEQFWQGEMRRELAPLNGRIEIRWYDGISYEDLLKRTAHLPPHSAIFWYQMIVDGAGVAHEGDRALTRLYQTANAPIFSHDDAFFGQEIVGGPMHSAYEGGKRAAMVAMRILNGEKAGDIKTEPSNFEAPRYDWRELQRWHINERLLPPGSKVDFREPSTWEAHRSQIIFICAVILMQAALISRLFYEQRRRQNAEVQARQRSAELAHFNRFSMAGELTASIAHELNQPLGAILTNAETLELILKSPTPDLDEVRSIVGDIRHDDERASEVIRRLRSLLKKAPFELKNVDLNGLVRETIEFVAAVAVARQVNLRGFVGLTPLPIRGDRIQLQQVIVNLIVNAMDAMTTQPSAERRIFVSTARVDEFAEVSVSDTGPGIPPAMTKEVFERVFTTKPHGMGMGLAIARTIVEAHNGRIWAENKVEGGATFNVRLPLV
jgi:signal transduction histidine kinase